MPNQVCPLVSPPNRAMRGNIAENQIGSSRHIARVRRQRAGTQVFLRLAETLTSRRKPGDIV